MSTKSTILLGEHGHLYYDHTDARIYINDHVIATKSEWKAAGFPLGAMSTVDELRTLKIHIAELEAENKALKGSGVIVEICDECGEKIKDNYYFEP